MQIPASPSRYSNVSSLAVREPPQRVAAVAVAAEARSVQLRLSSALGGQSAFQLRVLSSVRRLIVTGGADDLIVTYHEILGSDDCDSFKQLKSRFPELLIVAVCASADGRAVRRALDSGIDGLVFADELEAALEPTVAAALAGQIAVPRNLQPFVRKPALSAKERLVLGLLVRGCTNGEISAQLFLAESTVKSHLSSAYSKLGVRSRSEAVSLLLDPRQPLGVDVGVVSTVRCVRSGPGGRI
jgi:DNA-binding NarL/FixJ family response regulator